MTLNSTGQFSPDTIQGKTYLLLKQMIADTRIKPGERLFEAQVAKAFGISRSPARTALRALSDEKLINPAEGRGYIVLGVTNPIGKAEHATLDQIKIYVEPQWARMYQEVEQELCIRILFGSVRITEERLAEHFNVSRTVVRDVLGRMHSVGLISKDETGRWVAHRVTPARIRHLYEVRQVLEPYVLKQAAPYLTKAVLEKARENVRKAVSSFPAFSEDMDQVETDLHIDFLSYCPNKEFLQALARTHVLFVPTRYLEDRYLGIPPELIHAALQEHIDVIEKLLDNDFQGASARLYDHLRIADERWLRRFEITSNMTQLQFPSYLTALDI